MKPTSLKHLWLLLTVLAVAALACRFGAPAVEPTIPVDSGDEPAASELSQANRSRLISATVQIIALKNMGGELTPIYGGSGTILSPSGMILTNAHVASPASMGAFDLEPDALVVAMITTEDKPATPTYRAQVMAVDGFMDLAVIQITASVNGSPIDAASLNLPFVTLGNSDNIRIGDTVNIFGFPSIGGNTITFTKGSVSGFTTEQPIGDRAWVKTDATISGGNSGGLAADNNARIIGVPTIASSGADTDATDCRQIQDTNGDGVVDRNDSCIPIGGFINGLRPVNLAMPLIQAAQAGRQYTSPYRVPGVVSESGSGGESASEFVWLDTSGSAEKCEWADQTVSSYPAGTVCVASGFRYAGMTDGQLMLEHWYLNNEKIAEYSYVWEWGTNGLFGTYLPNEGKPLPAGSYRMELFAGENLKPIGKSSEVNVSGDGSSGGSQQQETDTDLILVFGEVYDAASNKPISGAYVFVLKPGITYTQWADSNFADEHIRMYTQTDTTGYYALTGIPRNVDFTLVYAAQGYINAYADNQKAGPNDPPLYELNVGLTK